MINTHGGYRPGSGVKPIPLHERKEKKKQKILDRNYSYRKRGKVKEGMFDVHEMENWAI